MSSIFEVNTITHHGFGITKSVLETILKDFRAPLLIIDPNIPKPNLPRLPVAIECPNGEPTYKGLDDLRREMIVQAADCIVALGGGSTMDYAKAVAALHNKSYPSIEFRGFDNILWSGIPCVCIPTTAGTGSEITPNASFIDTDTKTKLGINGRHMRATYAILDAEWTLTCPYSVALSSLLDAFVHAVESYMAPEATPLTRTLSREAFRLLYQNALSIKLTGHGVKTERQALLYGAYLAAMALSNSGSGVVGAMSYPLGVHFGIPHGFAGGIFLPDIVQHNTKAGFDFRGLNPTAGLSNDGLAYMLGDLWTRLEVPNLKQWIDADDVLPTGWLSDQALAKNPVPIQLCDAQNFIARHL